MFKRHWIAAIALGLTISTTGAWPQATIENEPNKEEGTTASQESSSDRQDQPIDFTPALEGIESAIRDLKAEEDKIERGREQQREIRDLSAQESMALWAKWMFFAASATVLLTFAALAAIIRTLHHTRRAADYTEGMLIEAKSTTEAAKATVRATEEIGALQLKAYVGVKAITITLIEDGDYVETDVKIVVGNTGATPATIPFLATTTEFRHVPEIKPNLGSTGHAQTGDRIVGPNSEFIISTGQRSKRLGDAPTGRYKIGALLKYRDIYGADSIESSWWHHRPFRTSYA